MKIKKSPMIAKPATIRISNRKKISLKAGDAFEVIEGGRTDEGYSYTRETYSREGNTLKLEVNTRAMDCDGPMDTYQELECHINDVHRKRPNWKVAGYAQKDYYAEAGVGIEW